VTAGFRAKPLTDQEKFAPVRKNFRQVRTHLISDQKLERHDGAPLGAKIRTNSMIFWGAAGQHLKYDQIHAEQLRHARNMDPAGADRITGPKRKRPERFARVFVCFTRPKITAVRRRPIHREG
jgi:hypothetical protein